VIYARTRALTQALAIEGAPRDANQLRRVRASPLGRYVCASSHVDNFAAIYALKQSAVSSRRRRRWAFASTATDGTAICAATTPRRRSSSSLLRIQHRRRL